MRNMDGWKDNAAVIKVAIREVRDRLVVFLAE